MVYIEIYRKIFRPIVSNIVLFCSLGCFVLAASCFASPSESNDYPVDYDFSQHAVSLQLQDHSVPALYVKSATQGRKRLAFYLHGFNSEKEYGIPEIARLANAGFDVVALDAPHHGERRSEDLERALTGSEEARTAFIMALVMAQASEVNELIEAYVAEGYSDISVLGISMGAVTAYYVPVINTQVNAIVPLLGTPSWEAYRDVLNPVDLENMPASRTDSFRPLKLFAINASKDNIIPPEHSRDFVTRLKMQNPEHPNRYTYQEFVNSDHFMSDRDWDTAWTLILAWLSVEPDES